MKATDLLKAIFYPLTESSVLVPLVVFWLLLSFAKSGGVLGILLMLLILPAVFRYQMIVLEARAKGKRPATPDVGFFNWFGNSWSLFPVVIAVIAVVLVSLANDYLGGAAAFLVLLSVAAVLPASFVVLAITHSPLQSLNPIAIGRLLQRCGDTFWIASVYLVIAGWLNMLTEMLPLLLANLMQLLLTFSFFSLTGALVQPYGLIEDVYIPDALEPDAAEVASELEQNRGNILTHAYGFVSRGNREGGFKHIIDGIDEDPDPAAAWAWYFDHMLQWDKPDAALFFAQLYVHDMLRHGEKIPALKLILRCRLVNDQWKPKTEDLPAAIEAAEANGNIELAAVLKRY